MKLRYQRGTKVKSFCYCNLDKWSEFFCIRIEYPSYLLSFLRFLSIIRMMYFQNSFNKFNYPGSIVGPFKGRSQILLSHRFFAQITPKNCLKLMFTPSLPNAGCQIDLSRNNAIFSIKFRFSYFELCQITSSRFPFGETCLVLYKCKRDRDQCRVSYTYLH